ncbi:folliculin-like isoform X1 [Dysidea avara]|uniref:folliculin-like isoform X1 n=1 Tax=Dysidea avara TaxID=196820 RepID=UPI0033289190
MDVVAPKNAEDVYHREIDNQADHNIPSKQLLPAPPNHHRRIKVGAAKQRSAGRSLMDLTAGPNIFCTLHRHFVYILKCGGSRLRESMVEGPPQPGQHVADTHNEVDDNNDDLSPLESSVSSLPPLERALTVPEFISFFSTIDLKDKHFFRSLRHLFSIREVVMCVSVCSYY